MLVFANTLGDAKKLKKELEEFCMHAKLSVNSSKTKIMLVKIQNNVCIIYNNESLESVESSKYLGLEVHLRTYVILEKLSVISSINTFLTLW